MGNKEYFLNSCLGIDFFGLPEETEIKETITPKEVHDDTRKNFQIKLAQGGN